MAQEHGSESAAQSPRSGDTKGTGANASGKLTKNQRREAAREKAKEFRQERERKAKRKRLTVQISVVAAVVVVIALVVTLVSIANRPAGPGPKNMASDGVLVGKGLIAQRAPARSQDAKPTYSAAATNSKKPLVQVYVDYMCPYCGEFEKTNSSYLEKQVKAGNIELQIHPVSILDTASTTKYSTRSATAAACVANYAPDSFFMYNRALFADQPKEESAGLSNSKLASLAKTAMAGDSKADSSAALSCIAKQPFQTWSATATQNASKNAIPGISYTKAPLSEGTPAIFVNGKHFTPTAQAGYDTFPTFVLQNSGQSAKSPAVASTSPSAS